MFGIIFTLVGFCGLLWVYISPGSDYLTMFLQILEIALGFSIAGCEIAIGTVEQSFERGDFVEVST